MRYSRTLVAIVFAIPSLSNAEDTDMFLNGTWVATAMERDGAAAGQEAVKAIGFRFSKETLFIRGNFPDDETEKPCKYKLKINSSPRQIDIVTDDGETIYGIYKWKMAGNELHLCLRHGNASKMGRPVEFKTKKGSEVILIKLKRQ